MIDETVWVDVLVLVVGEVDWRLPIGYPSSKHIDQWPRPIVE
jgi:hypothetical protein